MKDIPILFSSEMVRAILDGRKTLSNDQRHYRRHAERIKARERNKYHKNRAAIRKRRFELNGKHKAKNAERERLRHASVRSELLIAYGGKCCCCGECEPMFLELDHTNGGGTKHRTLIGRSSKTLYSLLKRQGFPKDEYRLLCANCNQGRHRNGGVCPHKK